MLPINTCAVRIYVNTKQMFLRSNRFTSILYKISSVRKYVNDSRAATERLNKYNRPVTRNRAAAVGVDRTVYKFEFKAPETYYS